MYNIYQHRKLQQVNNEPLKPSLTPIKRLQRPDSGSSTKSIHQHLRTYQKSSRSSTRLCEELVNTRRNTTQILNHIDYADEDKTLLVLLNELQTNKSNSKKKRTLIPNKPISYTKKSIVSNNKKYETKIEPTPPLPLHKEFRIADPSNSSLTDYEELGKMLPTHSRYEENNSLATPRPLSAPPGARPTSSNGRVSHIFLASVLPQNTQESLVQSKQKSIKVRNTSPDRTKNTWSAINNENDEHMDMLLDSLVKDYHVTTGKSGEYKKLKKQYQEYLQSQYHKDVPIMKHPFKRHFGSKDFGWTDPKVRELNKKIDSALVEQAVLERFESENNELIEKKIKVNQIRKVFKDQRQKNFLKRVVHNEPRVIQQLQDLVSNDGYFDGSNGKQSEAKDRDLDQEETWQPKPILRSALSFSESPNFMKFKNLIPPPARESLKSFYHNTYIHTSPTTSTAHSPQTRTRPKSVASTYRKNSTDLIDAELEPTEKPGAELAEIDLFEHRLKEFQKI